MSNRWWAGLLSSGVACVVAAGCGDQGNTKIIDAPPASAGESKPIPKTKKEGGGSGSSGNMNRNPGANS